MQKKVKTCNPLFHKEEEHAMRDICYKKADSSWMLENNDQIIKPFELPITQKNNGFLFTRCVQVEARQLFEFLLWTGITGSFQLYNYFAMRSCRKKNSVV